MALAVAAALMLRPPEAYLPREPARSTLTSPVEKRVLHVQTIGRGQIRAESATAIDCAPTTGGSAGAQKRVFTRPLTIGRALKEGDVVAAINGRPVIVLAGATAAFRDILPGSSGGDVKQLQAALRRLGYSVAKDRAGTFGSGTQAAISKLFGARGFKAVGPTREESSSVSAARVAAAQAATAVVQARAALRAASVALAADRLNARIALRQAQLTQSQATTSAERELAALSVRAARLQLSEAQRKTVAAEADALTIARTVSAQSQEEFRHLSASVGISVPFCEVVFVPRLPATVHAAAADTGGDSGETGETTDTAWATLTGATLILEAQLSDAEAEVVRTGAHADVRFDGATDDLGGRVTEVTTDAAGQKVARIQPDVRFPGDALNANVRVTIDVRSTDTSVLVVPVAAVSGTATGDAKVTVITADEDATEVPVVAGLASAGFVEVTPLSAAALKEGDRVRVGS